MTVCSQRAMLFVKGRNMSCKGPKRTSGSPVKINHDLERLTPLFSHDLQEPLRKIQVFAELLNITLPDKTVSKKYAVKINGLAKHMSELIQDVHTYLQLFAREYLFEEVDLNLIMSDTVEKLKPLIDQKNATVISFNLLRITGIREQLYQLFYQMISNSLKFSIQEPFISVTCSEVMEKEMKNMPGYDPRKRYIKVIFKDNGIGFDQKYAEQIFIIFQRLHDKSIYNGTGTGLAICKKVIENHNGAINTCSSVNNGSAFTIYLPV